MGIHVILGGTHGLGREIAAILQSRGEQTYVLGRSFYEDRDGTGQKLDISDRRAVSDFCKQIPGMSIDSFYWVAGSIYSGNFADQSNVTEMIDVNFTNPMMVAQAIWQCMQDSANTTDRTNFVIVASTSGVRARASQITYAATKHAQVGFGRSLGLESERLQSSVQVALFLPGGMQTPLWDNQRPAEFDTFMQPAKVAQQIVASVTVQTENFRETMIERGTV